MAKKSEKKKSNETNKVLDDKKLNIMLQNKQNLLTNYRNI